MLRLSYAAGVVLREYRGRLEDENDLLTYSAYRPPTPAEIENTQGLHGNVTFQCTEGNACNMTAKSPETS